MTVELLAQALNEVDAAEQAACVVRFASMNEWMAAQSRLLAARLRLEEAERAATWTREDA